LRRPACATLFPYTTLFRSIWDRLSAHRKAAKVLQDLRWIDFTYLPAYCPELNPVEHVWSTTKWGRLANWPAPDIESVGDRVSQDLSDQTSHQGILRSHFAWAGLNL